MSCGPACARQLLLDAGIDESEARIRELADFHPEFGVSLDALGKVLDELHPGARYKSGAVEPERLHELASVVPFIALLRTPSKHFVIVQEILETEVRIRDPAGLPSGTAVGLEGVMDRTAFVDRWTRAINGVLFRCA